MEKNLTIEQGLEAIMAIIDAAEVAPKKETAAATPVVKKETPKETVYDGRGHVLAVDGKQVAKGYKKGAKRVKTSKDNLRDDLMNDIEVVLNRVAAFTDKVGRNSVEGIVIRLADADYTVKLTGHTTREYEDREEGFKAQKNYITRGSAENHSPAIMKVIVEEIEKCFPNLKIENQKSVTLLAASASATRFEIGDAEFSFKVTKKRSRVVMN